MSESTKADKAEGKSGGGKGKLIVIGAVVAVLLLGGGGAAAFFMSKQKAQAEEGEDEDGEAEVKKAKDKKKKKKKDDGKPPVFVTLDPFTVNLADTEADRFAQVAVVLQVEDEKVGEKIKAHLPAVRNAILLQLSSRTSKELLTVEGKAVLAEAIMKAAATRTDEEGITEVLFSQFIVQ